MTEPNAIQPAATGGSPFDAIRRIRPDGSEYWSARELMPLLGYVNWQNFAEAINRAMISAKMTGVDTGREFSQVTQVTGVSNLGGIGHGRVDYELTRRAAYLVAMCGDVRKPEIAAAQAYFAINARENEIRRELTRKEILLLALEAEERAEKAERRELVVSNQLTAAEAVIEAHAPDVLFAQDYLATDGLKTVAQFGRDTRIGPIRIFGRLREIGAWQAVEHRPYIEHVRAGYYRHDPVSGEVMVTPKGEKWLHGKLFGRIGDQL